MGDTPAAQRKRNISSPDNSLVVKRIHAASESSESELSNTSADMHQILEVPEVPTTSLSLDSAAIKDIASALRDAMLSEVKEYLKETADVIVRGIFTGLQSQVKDLVSENASLRSENAALSKRVTALENLADTSEQYSRRNSLRISGVKENAGENLYKCVLDLCDSIGAECT